jgi:hypothetical protein
MRSRFYGVGVLLLSMAVGGAAGAQSGGGFGGGYSQSFLDQFGAHQGRLVVREYFAGGTVPLPETRLLAVDTVVLSTSDSQSTQKMFGLRLQVRVPKQGERGAKHQTLASAHLDFDQADLLLTALSRIEELARRPENADPDLAPEVRFAGRGGILVSYGAVGAAPPVLVVQVPGIDGQPTTTPLTWAQMGEFKALIEKSVARLKTMGAKLPDGMGNGRGF